MNKELKELYNYLIISNLNKEALSLSKFVKTATPTFDPVSVQDFINDYPKYAQLLATHIRNSAFPSDSIFDNIADDYETFLVLLESSSIPDDTVIGEKKPDSISKFYTRKPFGKNGLKVNTILSVLGPSQWSDYTWEIYTQSKEITFESSSVGEYKSKLIQAKKQLKDSSGLTWCRYYIKMQVYVDDDMLYPDIYYVLRELKVEVDKAALTKLTSGGGGGGGLGGGGSTITPKLPISYAQVITEALSFVNPKDGDTLTIDSKKREISFVKTFENKLFEVINGLEEKFSQAELDKLFPSAYNYDNMRAGVIVDGEYKSTDKTSLTTVVKLVKDLEDKGKISKYYTVFKKKPGFSALSASDLILNKDIFRFISELESKFPASGYGSITTPPPKKKKKKSTPKTPSTTTTDPYEDLDWDL